MSAAAPSSSAAGPAAGPARAPGHIDRPVLADETSSLVRSFLAQPHYDPKVWRDIASLLETRDLSVLRLDSVFSGLRVGADRRVEVISERAAIGSQFNRQELHELSELFSGAISDSRLSRNWHLFATVVADRRRLSLIPQPILGKLLLSAVRFENEAIVRTLLSSGCIAGNGEFIQEMFCFARKHEAILRAFLAWEQLPLYLLGHAISDYDVPATTMRILLDCDRVAEVTKDRLEQALNIAAGSGWVDHTSTLLRKGRMNALFVLDALTAAAMNGYEEIVRMLLSCGPVVNMSEERYLAYRSMAWDLADRRCPPDAPGRGSSYPPTNEYYLQALEDVMAQDGLRPCIPTFLVHEAIQSSTENGHEATAALLRSYLPREAE